MKLQGHGIETNLPAGWEGRISVRPGGAPDPNQRRSTPNGDVTTSVGPTGSAGEQHFPVTHLANFPLPEDRGDFGSGAVDIMTPEDVLVVLAEYGPECVNTPLFARQGVPTNLTPNLLSSTGLQRLIPGQAGVQVFFSVNNRAFCCYTVVGRQANAPRLLPQANAALQGTRINAR